MLGCVDDVVVACRGVCYDMDYVVRGGRGSCGLRRSFPFRGTNGGAFQQSITIFVLVDLEI